MRQSSVAPVDRPQMIGRTRSMYGMWRLKPGRFLGETGNYDCVDDGQTLFANDLRRD
jgi:hypothetical protein